MSVVLAGSAVFGDVPHFDGSSAGAHRYLRTLLVPMDAGDAVRIQVTEFGDSVVVRIPEVEAGVEGH